MRKRMMLIVLMISLFAIMLAACSAPVAVSEPTVEPTPTVIPTLEAQPEPTVIPTPETQPEPAVPTISTPIGDFTYSQDYTPIKSWESIDDGYIRLNFELRPYSETITLGESYEYDFDNAQAAIGDDLYDAEGSNIVYTSGQIGIVTISFIVEESDESVEAKLILP